LISSVVRLLSVGLLLAGCRGAAREAEAAGGGPPGRYALGAIGEARLPITGVGALIPGEGMSVRGGRLELRPDGRMAAHLDLLWTDSGTVSVARGAVGRWERRGEVVLLDYRWCVTARCADSTAARDTARVTAAGLAVPELLGLGPRMLGSGRPLGFHRLP
jgi:hypothetical protein